MTQSVKEASSSKSVKRTEKSYASELASFNDLWKEITLDGGAMWIRSNDQLVRYHERRSVGRSIFTGQQSREFLRN